MTEKKNKTLCKNELLNELMSNQIKDIDVDKKLKYTDMKRICKYISTSIFDKNMCCIWNGYVTNINNINKGVYINFYFGNKKIALHRLLYINFVEKLADDEYLKYNCDNKGKCCNINHLRKFRYINIDTENTVTEPKNEPDKIKKDNRDVNKRLKQVEDDVFILSFN